MKWRLFFCPVYSERCSDSASIVISVRNFGVAYSLDRSDASFVKPSKRIGKPSQTNGGAMLRGRGPTANQIKYRQPNYQKEKIHLCKIDTSSSEQSYQPSHFYRERKQ